MDFSKLFFLCSLFLFSSLVRAQGLSDADHVEMQEGKERMATLVKRVYTDSAQGQRFEATRDLIKQLVQTLDRPHSFDYAFGDVPGLSIQYAPDSTFRIFTWELNVDREQYRHYGAIQRNAKDLQLIPLVDRGDDWLENPENALVGADNWLGYAVYDILPGDTYEGRPYYFVLGYDSYSTYRRRKVLDVLYFDEEGRPKFGLPVFTTYTDSGLLLADRARIILEYAAEATVALREDDELGGLIYENLIMMPGSNGEGPVQVPDGSYHLLEIDQTGHWRENEQVFDHKYEEAPREVPRPSEGRDIFGRGNKPGGGGSGR
ncbi:hypothetical protein [Lewinella sp. IMCC34191]|uniref:hypothetical protein n=1 Tax=Lewinella sp. IMCC34191 TaxID=2259172 RepID=UPI000E256C7D|nr:hypothetical protein [Lewinella sp. IMCC34191]